jgi:hypothetical protein
MMMMMGRISIVVTVLCAIARPVAAQSAEAETLFRDGKKLIKAGNLDEGCAKLDASERLESSTGTLLNLGDCREQNHQLASAWAAFGKAASSAKKDHDPKREAEARRRAKVLEAKLGKLTINVRMPVTGLEIVRNDQSIDQALWSSEIPTDAGVYVIKATAPGFKPWTSSTVVVKDGEKAAIEVPALEKAPAAAPELVTVTERHDAPHPQPAAQASSFTSKRKVAVVLGVVGIAGVAVGSVFGVKSRDLRDRADALCPNAGCADPNAIAFNHDAQTDATRANIGFIAGGALIAGAVVLWVVGAPSPTDGVNVSIAPSASSVTYTGHF